MSLTVQVASVPDRDELVAEIWQGDEMVAEVQRTPDKRLLLEIYNNPAGQLWSLDLTEWLTALARAQKELTW